MNLKIEKADLLDGINIVSKAVRGGGTIPILNCILINASDNGVRLMGNSLEMGIQTSVIEADVQRPGDIALEARLFSEIVRKLPDGYIQITVDNKYATKIKSGLSEFKIMGSDPADFPAMPEVEHENVFSINQNTLRDMIRKTIFAVSEDDTKPAFTGELIEVENGMINIVSTDGYRVAYRYSEADPAGQSFKVIVPGKPMAEIAKLLTGSDESQANIYFTDKHILFDLGTCKVVTQVINGEFLKYKDVFTTNHSTLVKLVRSEFIASLDRASLVAIESNRKTPVKLVLC